VFSLYIFSGLLASLVFGVVVFLWIVIGWWYGLLVLVGLGTSFISLWIKFQKEMASLGGPKQSWWERLLY